MKKRLVKFAGWTLASVAALAMILVVVVLVRSQRRFDAPYPEVVASKDPKVIARGRFLAYGPAHCVNCHVPSSESKAVENGATPLLTGGHLFDLPLGKIYTPNLTPDRETGIGRYSDRELARVLRHGVMPDGRAALPFMEAQHFSEEDMTALISFLRSQEPVRKAIPRHKLNFLGKAVMAFVIKPIGPTRAIRETTPHEGTLENGEYLATSVATCSECHTPRNLMTGAYAGAKFSGGMVFQLDKERVIVSPNLTPSRVGRITTWSEEQFVGRFNAGVGLPGTHMPWRQFQTMSDADKRAIFRYLRTLEPVDHDPGPSIQTKEQLKARKKGGGESPAVTGG